MRARSISCEVLMQTRSAGYRHYCWGYPFRWETRHGTMRAGIPLITTVPYVYEAFRQVHQIDGTAEVAGCHGVDRTARIEDYHDIVTSPNASSCSYNPDPNEPGMVVNASAYRAFLLTQAAQDFQETKYQGNSEPKSEFCAGVAERRRFLALLHRRRAQFCGSLPHVLCAEGVEQRSKHSPASQQVTALH